MAFFKHHSQRGFTLMEICMVLLLMAVLTGLILPQASSLFQKHRLQEISRQLQTLAQTAQQKSIVQYQHYYILFKKDVIELHENDEEILDQISLDKTTQYKIMGYDDSDWRMTENTKWWFSPSGMAMPMRISLKDKDSWLEISFDPLTMGVMDERYQLN